jgi:hypothetical protein
MTHQSRKDASRDSGRNVDSPLNRDKPTFKPAESLNMHGGPYTKKEQKVPPRKPRDA